MSDLVSYLDYLRFHHVSEESLKDKDRLKNEAYQKYSVLIYQMSTLPIGFQIAELYYANNPATRQMFKGVRNVKLASVFALMAVGYWERSNLEKKWLYYDRLYPEPTALQRALVDEAKIALAHGDGAKSIEERKVEIRDPAVQANYKNFYQLPYQKSAKRVVSYNGEGNKDRFEGR